AAPVDWRADMTAPATPPNSQRLHEAFWPDMFADLLTAYTDLNQAQDELKRRAAEVEKRRDLFQQVIASMSEALFLLDHAGRVTQVNPAACKLLECPAAELEKQPFDKVCGNDRVPATPWRLLEKAPAGTLNDLEVELGTRAGQTRFVSFSCNVV